ncbi:tetratricopeptide repeat protein [Streptomyces samsunensis]|uniref:tetratricopeptide repeat protein n=1 Tax=Streptomyces malaysiensis TaxID=92644 RepID=UPI001582433B|nr:tetratricopeptide repeat protein [Streptomyces samsunensis]NUH42913.1 tetratricopeptide repeat protein [Streptomyces samsunensis]
MGRRGKQSKTAPDGRDNPGNATTGDAQTPSRDAADIGSPKSGVWLSGTGDANATQGGLAITGHIGALQVEKFTVVSGPREPAAWPHQVGTLPPQARSFQHRGEDELLRATIGHGIAATHQARDVSGTRGGVLIGMGGVGKTQLAAAYARTAWQEGSLDVLVWINASTRSAVISGYAQAGVELCRADPTDPEQAARTFLAWLTPKAGSRTCRWLVVLDDLADPDDVRGLWPPASQTGRLLVTTRRRDTALAGEDRRMIEVGLFAQAEAVAYLTAVLAAHNCTEPETNLAALAADLGYLPLALSQAAAYLIDAGIRTSAYRELLADRTATLADAIPDCLPDDQPLPLSAVWSLSMDRADALRPTGLARPMLQLASMLDPSGIPHTVLTSPPALHFLASHRTAAAPKRSLLRRRSTRRSPAQVTTKEAVGALRALHRLSLLQHTPNSPHQAIRVHQLIQRATRESLTRDRHYDVGRTAATALFAAWPDTERDSTLAQRLRDNATALATCAEHALYRPDPHLVLYKVGESLGEVGQVVAAYSYFKHLANATAHHVGSDHAGTLGARAILARWRGAAGDAAGAAAALAELLEDVVRVLGPDHPDTLAVRHAHARWRGAAGDAAGAAAALAELLEDVVRVLGDAHPCTLDTRGQLAAARGNMGDEAGAAAAFAELLDDRLRVLGPDHPSMLPARNNLAYWRGRAGDAAGAAAAFSESLGDMVRVLGDDHPDTLMIRNNLAAAQYKAGDAAGAAAALGELLEDMVRVLGPDHPEVLSTRSNLATARGAAGDAAGAAAALGELLEDMVRVLGPDHPDTLATRQSFATALGEAGDAASAAATFSELLGDMVRVLGDDHPGTLMTRNDLACWRVRAGDAAGAVAAFSELLDDRLRVLGGDHPDTLMTRNNLATTRYNAGDAAGAVAAFSELLDDRLRVLGPDHPEVLSTRNKLAIARRAAWVATARHRSNGQRAGRRRSVGEMGADDHE